MNKKLISALFVGALLLGSTSALTSCKDYDDDIDNLQTQIDKMATADQLSSNVATLQAAITAAQTAATNAATAAKTAADAAAKAQTAADAAATQKALDAAIAELKSQISTKADQTALDNAVKALQEALGTKVDKTVYDGAIAKLESSIGAKVDTIAYNAAVNALYEAVALKADKTALTEAIATLNEAIGKKVDQTAFDAAVAQLKADIATKVNQSDYEAKVKELEDALGTKVDIVEYTARIAALEATLDTKANQTALDDAVARLESLIDAKANKADIETALSEVYGAIGVNTNAIDRLKGTVDELAKNVDAYVKALTDKEAEDVKGLTDLLTDQYKALNVITTKLIGEVSSMITSVDLFSNTNASIDNILEFIQAVEKENTFGPSGEIKFIKDKLFTYSDSLVIRVAPTTASLIKDNISLINSKGESLDDFIDIKKIEPYTDLLTRSASANGLWKVIFKIKDNINAEEFSKKIMTDDKMIAFAVAIKSTLTGATDENTNRRVVSDYGVTISPKNAEPASELDFTVNKIAVADINNRYNVTTDIDGNSIAEYKWNNDGAQTKMITGSNSNVTVDTSDDRSSKNNLPVVKGVSIPIVLSGNIKAFYVELDSLRAIESAPSELNAWTSYDYDGLNKVQYGNNGSITIKDLKNVTNDVIGFRIYAVNYDGTLVDPDGKAFYVVVGKKATEADVSGEFKAESIDAGNAKDAKFNSVTRPLDATFATFSTTSDEQEGTARVTLDASSKANTISGNPTMYYILLKSDEKTIATDWKDAKYIRVTVPNAGDYLDNTIYKGTITAKNTSGITVNIINLSIKKVLPQSSPEGSTFGWKAQQLIDGVYTSYLTPTDGWNTAYAAGLKNTTGFKALENVCNGLSSDNNYKIVIANAAKDATGAYTKDLPVTAESLVTDPVTYTYKMIVPTALIDNNTAHQMKIFYTYENVSTTSLTDPNKRNQNYDALLQNVSIKFADILNTTLQTYFWVKRTGEGTEASPYIYTETNNLDVTYGITNEISGEYLKGINLFDNTFTGLFSVLDAKYPTGNITATLKSNDGNQEDYFTVTYSNSTHKFTFNPKSQITVPAADVPSTLRVEMVDAFGNTNPYLLNVTVKKP